MAKAKKTCPECDGELLEDDTCPNCGPSENTEKKEIENEEEEATERELIE